MKVGGGTINALLVAALLALAVIVALLVPTTLEGQNTQVPQATSTVYGPGRLLVRLTLNNGSSVTQPMPGVSVAIARFQGFRLRLAFVTNASGEVEVGLEPGQYGVTTGDQRFTLTELVGVSAGNLTMMNVLVNKTATYSIFAQAEDTSSSGTIEPWDKMFVELSSSPTQVYFGELFQNATVPVILGSAKGSASSGITFGSQVFIQPVHIYLQAEVGYAVRGPEVPASVVSQASGGGVIWLTLQPLQEVRLAGSSYLAIVSYQARSLVSYLHV